MKRWLLFGILLVGAALLSGCATCGGYGVCGIQTACSPCAGGCVTGGCLGGCSTHYVSPYAGQYYSGEDCGSCGTCDSCYSGCALGFRPLARLHRLFGGGNSCGCACEKYYGDYINNPPNLCYNCDEFGGLAGYVGGCQSGACGTSYGYASPQPVFAPPVVTPFSSQSGCKSCQEGFASQTPMRPQPMPQQFAQTSPQIVQPAPQKIVIVRTQPQAQQTLISRGPQLAQNQQPQVVVLQQPQAVPMQQYAQQQVVQQQINPIRQVSTGQSEQFGTTSKVVQPSRVTSSGKVVHAR